MTYRGKDKFYSFFGGLVSALVLILIVAIFFYKLVDVFHFNQTTIKKNTLVTMSNTLTPKENLSQKNITIAFMMSDFWNEIELNDPTYGQFQLIQFAMIFDTTTGVRTTTNYNVPFSKCKLGVNFNYPHYEEISLYKIDRYFCPDWNNNLNLTLQGNWHAPEYRGIAIRWQRCSSDPNSKYFYPNCRNDTDFKQWFKQATLQEVAINSYFDGNDYENPVKYFLDDLFVSLKAEETVIYNSYFKKNQISLQDD